MFWVFLWGGGAELVWMYFCLGKYQLHVNQSPCMLQRCSSGLQGVATLLYAFVRFFRFRNRLDGPFSGDKRQKLGRVSGGPGMKQKQMGVGWFVDAKMQERHKEDKIGGGGGNCRRVCRSLVKKRRSGGIEKKINLWGRGG